MRKMVARAPKGHPRPNDRGGGPYSLVIGLLAAHQHKASGKPRRQGVFFGPFGSDRCIVKAVSASHPPTVQKKAFPPPKRGKNAVDKKANKPPKYKNGERGCQIGKTSWALALSLTYAIMPAGFASINRNGERMTYGIRTRTGYRTATRP